LQTVGIRPLKGFRLIDLRGAKGLNAMNLTVGNQAETDVGRHGSELSDSEEILLRPFRPGGEDERQMRELVFGNAFPGAPFDTICPCKKWSSDVVLTPYIKHQPENIHVAVHQPSGRLIGYLTGSLGGQEFQSLQYKLVSLPGKTTAILRRLRLVDLRCEANADLRMPRRLPCPGDVHHTTALLAPSTDVRGQASVELSDDSRDRQRAALGWSLPSRFRQSLPERRA